jgi:hypothetical protein
MSTFHFFYTRKNQLPTGVNIQADDEADALETFKHLHKYEDIIYITKLETLWSLKKTL